MSKRDKLRIEITGSTAAVATGDILLGDEKCGWMQLYIGEPGRRMARRLRKAGVEIIFPNYTKSAKSKLE